METAKHGRAVPRTDFVCSCSKVGQDAAVTRRRSVASSAALAGHGEMACFQPPRPEECTEWDGAGEELRMFHKQRPLCSILRRSPQALAQSELCWVILLPALVRRSQFQSRLLLAISYKIEADSEQQDARLGACVACLDPD